MEYDVFISFKNTDENGDATEDSKIAEQLFLKFKDAGIKAFYSNVVLQEVGAAAYKNVIEDVLERAAVLVCVATDVKYLESKWVAYERESFHNDILSGRKKDAALVSYLKNIAGTDIPRSLRNYQTFLIDRSSPDDVVEFVKAFLASNRSGKVEMDNAPISLTTGKHLSNYTPAVKTELNRLKIQSDNTHEVDAKAISYVLEKLGKDKQVSVLDMGCAYGFVTKDRFASIPEAKVVGVDNNAKVIDYAKEKNSFDGVSYHVLDLEGEDLEEELESIAEQRQIEKFDIIFASLVLHHLKNPNKLLRRIRKFLSDDGFIIVRGSDDGSVVSYNDDGLIDKIITLHTSCDGISDRMNGRKIYYQLVSSGYKDVKMMSGIKDISTLDMDERYDVFKERFAYRRNYLKMLSDKDPLNVSYKKDLEAMDVYLSELENKFADESFWYCEIDFVGIAKKKTR